MSDMNTYKHHDGRVFRISDASDTKPSDMSAAEEIQDLRFHLNGVCEELDIKDKIIMRLAAERDEARREVCQLISSYSTPSEIAERRGWDCFKEKTEKTPNAMADLCGWDAFENM